ncbi:MAG: hypothetical protein D6796_08800, partial [Caldilineae bacterium]
GCDDVLRIPLTKAELAARVRVFLRVAERTAQLQERVAEVEQLNRALTDLLDELQQAHRQTTQTARRLAAANAELEAFAYSISHDLRAPLRAINGFAQILDERYRQNLNTEGQRYLHNIVRAGSQMDRLISDLLAYARLGRDAIVPHPLPLQPILEDVLDTFGGQIERAGGTLTLPDHAPAVRGDPTLLRQILFNLVQNAITYVHPHRPPRIAITCRLEGEHVLLRVTDNGIGIAPKHHTRIFNLFQRLHPETQYPGSGVGLAMVKKAADLLGGEVGVQSKEGEGSTFWVKLPAAR